jgi:hypothetical protein
MPLGMQQKYRLGEVSFDPNLQVREGQAWAADTRPSWLMHHVLLLTDDLLGTSLLADVLGLLVTWPMCTSTCSQARVYNHVFEVVDEDKGDETRDKEAKALEAALERLRKGGNKK